MNGKLAPEECTTWSYRLRHLSLNLAAGSRNGRQLARTLCNADAWSQSALDERSRLWRPDVTKKRIADLPPCTKCARKAAKL